MNGRLHLSGEVGAVTANRARVSASHWLERDWQYGHSRPWTIPYKPTTSPHLHGHHQRLAILQRVLFDDACRPIKHLYLSYVLLRWT